MTEEYRSAKRAEIARAAMSCLQRHGVARTTMADIIVESGASAGSIYSNFAGKADIARYVAGEVVGAKIIALGDLAARRGEIAPSETLAFVLSGISEDDTPTSVIVQLWGEATVDPELGAVVRETLERLRGGFTAAVLPWARAATDTEEEAVELAGRKATVMASIGQAYIVTRALTGADVDPRVFLQGIQSLDDA